MKKILLFLLTFLACAYSAQAEWYVVGAFTGWSSSKAFTDNGDGTFTLDYEGTIDKGQGFKIYNGSWGNSGDNDSNIFGKPNGGDNITLGTSYSLDCPGDNMNLASKVTNPRFVFNPTAKTLLVTADGSSSYPDLFLRTAKTGYDTSYKFYNNNDGTYDLTVEDASVLSGYEFEISDYGYSTKYGYSFEGNQVTFDGGSYRDMYSDNGTKVKMGNFTGKVTFSLKYESASKVVLTAAPELSLLYYESNAWQSSGLKFTTEDGVNFTLNNVTITPGATFAIGNCPDGLKFGIDGVTMTPAATLAEASNRTGWSSNGNYGKWAETIERNVNIVATLGSVQSWGRQIDFKVYYVEGTTPDPDPYPEKIYYYFDSKSDMLEIAAMDQANGVYEATLTIAENASFRFYSNSNKADAYAYGPTNTSDNVAISLGEKVEMKNTSTNRWQLTNTAGEYTFTVDLKNKTFTVVAKSVEYTKYYLRGDMNGWASPEVGDDTWELKTTDGLTYTLNNVTLVSGQQFKIGQAGESGWVGYCYGDTDGQKAIYPDGSEYKIYKDNSGNLKFDYVYDRPVNITFTLASIDSNEATLKVVYVDGAEITYPTLYLRGDFSGSWETNDAYKFTKSGDVYTLTVNGNDVKNKEWAIATEGYTYNFGVSEAITVTDGTKLSWNSNKGAQAGFGELEDAKYVLEYTYSTQTLKVTKQGAVVTYPDLWLRGGFNNWGNDGPEKNTAYKFTCTDGVYTLTVEAGKLSNCEFKIGSSETGVGVDWAYGFGGTATDGVTAKIGEAFTVYDKKGGKNIYIAENSYKFDIKFEPDFVNNTGELTISINNPSGIEDVEISNEAPVEFYNLQGVRVDGELTPGLYIRRQGGNASKILIR